jgi:hypothetical protein
MCADRDDEDIEGDERILAGHRRRRPQAVAPIVISESVGIIGAVKRSRDDATP